MMTPVIHFVPIIWVREKGMEWIKLPVAMSLSSRISWIERRKRKKIKIDVFPPGL
jgi:hypothetical protein